MKVYQLLQAFDFDELMPVINDMFPGTNKFRNQLNLAYNMLCEMKPVSSKKAIKYKILPGDTPNHSYIGAEDRQFDATWEVLLGMDISRERGVDLSDVELISNAFVNICLIGRGPHHFAKAHAMLLQG